MSRSREGWTVVEEPEETVNEDDAAPEPTEASLEELLAKKGEEGGDEPDDAAPGTAREERVETLSVKVVPQQPTEFVCKSCYLVKHRSQLADKKRMYCRDCV